MEKLLTLTGTITEKVNSNWFNIHVEELDLIVKASASNKLLLRRDFKIGDKVIVIINPYDLSKGQIDHRS